MDNIYAGSLLTIVAGACNSAEDPLRGVSTERYCRQITREISPDVTLLAQVDIENLFNESTYCERAWTFQEFQLASRLLVFAPNDQVYFLCDEASYTEDGPDDFVSSSPDRLQVSNSKREFTFSLKRRLHGHLPQTNYRWAMTKYSRLKLTKDEDILNAFAGVVKRIGVGDCFEGLPVAYFDHALFWQGADLKRRKGFPSWAWAGWIGLQLYVSEELDYIHLFGDEERYKDCEHRQWVHKATEMELMQLSLKHATWIVYFVWDSTSTEKQPRLLRGEEPVKGVNPATEAHEARFPGLPWNVLPTKSCYQPSEHISSAVRKRPSVLHFWTVSVYYELGDNTGRDGAKIIDSEGKVVGECEFDGSINSERGRISVQFHEFIIISEQGDLNQERRKSSTYVPSEKYNVILIDWNGAISERIGSGHIGREAVFKSCRRPMEWKEILLG